MEFLNVKKLNMKINLLLATCMAMCIGNANSQQINLSFVGSADAHTLDSVIVVNMNTLENVTLNGTDALLLSENTNVIKINDTNKGVNIFPNPSADVFNIEFSTENVSLTVFSITDITGKMVYNKNTELNKGIHHLQISSLTKGIYFVAIKNTETVLSSILISESDQSGQVKVQLSTKSIKDACSKPVSRSIVSMEYHTGERLMFVGFAENMKMATTFVPIIDAEIQLNFHSALDGDFNQYTTVEIGNQVWFAENLKTSKFTDESIISNVTDNNLWNQAVGPAMCWFNNQEANANLYGGLYNWLTLDPALNGDRNVCPAEWHVASLSDWTELINYAGGLENAGAKLRTTGIGMWPSPNSEATNEFAFSIVPAGNRYFEGMFYSLNSVSLIWTGTPSDNTNANYVYFPPNSSSILSGTSEKLQGFSIRCIKD